MAIALPLRPTSQQPAGYYLSQGYHSGHHALDMVGHYRQPVYAVDSGQVFAASWGGGGWAIGGGYSILLNHFGEGNRFAKTGYAHLATMVVATGQYVLRGQLIGYSDSTGNSTGNHLHFSTGECTMGANPYYYNSYVWLDPRRYMRAHTYANGSRGDGNLIGSWHLGRNTIRVNGGVNLRSGPGTGYAIVRTTSVASWTVFLGRVTGASLNGSNQWNRVYDPGSGRIVYVHVSLGGWVT